MEEGKKPRRPGSGRTRVYDHAAAIALVRGGFSCRAAAAALGCHTESVRYAVRLHEKTTGVRLQSDGRQGAVAAAARWAGHVRKAA